MLHLVTGVPGASKTAFVVTKLDEIERKNKVHLQKNKVVYAHNMPLFEIYRSDFGYLEIETGSAHELKIHLQVLPNDYFDFLTQDFDDLRPDFYFQRSTQYNEIIERINEREGKQKFEYLQDVRTIYSNINALKIDYTRALIKDWREAPDGSIFVIDEVQLVEPYSDTKKKDDIVQDLTVHRHRGFDFYFITQSPSFLHPTVKELIGVHYHITRPYGRTPKVYQFGSTRQYPNTLINKLNCESKFSFKPQDRIFKLYKSTTINTHQKRLPAGLIPLALFVGCAAIMLLWGLNDKREINKTEKEHVQQLSSANQQTIKTIASNNQNQQLADKCRHAENLDKPECKQWFDQLSKSGASVGVQQNAQVNSVSYNPSKPFDDSNIANTIQYTVVNKPVFAGCVKYNGQYTAYTEQGTKLKVSQNDCKKIMAGDRPYDYFRSHSSNATNTTLVSNQTSNTDNNLNQSNVRVVENTSTFPEKDITKPSV
ncbi:zonular occludens toxin domain-containing protein [Acinetobacter sp. MD2]|uniref:zonular occludens toxin domain-containing protein n=1 Tax=Acinetobacter sp. MD2 TaxID=2600066 RepID=UPI002D1EAF79|nr:zonular occludens toxin domain-containing protein [Acinetobacter sp. MD2]MEB3767719.1 hypothetical protein [Acinetobacter sp. MD2]